MPCLWCASERMKPEFWDTGWIVKDNPFYIQVVTKADRRTFRTKYDPRDVIAQWRKDGGLCFKNKFIPWGTVIEVTWEPNLDKELLEPEETT